MKYLIVGLGNIGEEYRHTRHNIGFDVADAFVKKHEGRFELDRLADVATVKWKGKVFVVIKPTTYMNLSGKAVKYWMDKEKIPVEQMLVIVDELALPLTTNRLRSGGSDAGHLPAAGGLGPAAVDGEPRSGPVGAGPAGVVVRAGRAVAAADRTDERGGSGHGGAGAGAGAGRTVGGKATAMGPDHS